MMSTPPSIHDNVETDYSDYLRDESRRTGCAGSISFPVSEEEIHAVLVETAAAGLPVTTQGARTGITGGAVPDGGHILNLSRMNRMTGMRRAEGEDAFYLTVQPGVLLSEIRDATRTRELDTQGWTADSLAALEAFRAAGTHMFAPDLTEVSASAGGLTACNGSGARSFFYGATRANVQRVRVMLADGSAVELERGCPRATGRTFSLTTEGGRAIEGGLPTYEMPRVKNAAGYYAEDDMDLLDLFIGSEGTLGILTEIDIKLVPAPGAMWGVTAFFPAEEPAIRFVTAVRCADQRPAAVEFLDKRALNLLRSQKESNPAFKEIPGLPAAWDTAVYVEYHGPDEDSVEGAVAEMSEILETCGGDMEATWLAAGAREIERFKGVRHAVPEAVNLTIDERRKQEPRLTKLGTDLAVPDERLGEVVALYHDGLDEAGLDFVMFGHIGNNHIHVNIIPRTMEEYDRGKALYLAWAGKVVAMGGTVSAEHGIGKLKTAMLLEMYGEQGIEEMRRVKRLFDPEWRLSPGNLF
jgi:D-lactate dehydrogenase (cytochrome)